jgi:hypothetical protein
VDATRRVRSDMFDASEVHVVRVLAAMACREQPDAGMARVVDPRDADRLAHDVAVGGERELGRGGDLSRCELLIVGRGSGSSVREGLG